MCFKKLIFVLSATIGLVSCISALYIPTQNDALSQNTSLEKLRQGRELYMTKCGGCHNLYLPSSYNSNAWESLLNEMQKRTRIDDSQKKQIAKYLETNCKK